MKCICLVLALTLGNVTGCVSSPHPHESPKTPELLLLLEYDAGMRGPDNWSRRVTLVYADGMVVQATRTIPAGTEVRVRSLAASDAHRLSEAVASVTVQVDPDTLGFPPDADTYRLQAFGTRTPVDWSWWDFEGDALPRSLDRDLADSLRYLIESAAKTAAPTQDAPANELARRRLDHDTRGFDG